MAASDLVNASTTGTNTRCNKKKTGNSNPSPSATESEVQILRQAIVPNIAISGQNLAPAPQKETLENSPGVSAQILDPFSLPALSQSLLFATGSIPRKRSVHFF
jgi:hypothetical protein